MSVDHDWRMRSEGICRNGCLASRDTFFKVMASEEAEKEGEVAAAGRSEEAVGGLLASGRVTVEVTEEEADAPPSAEEIGSFCRSRVEKNSESRDMKDFVSSSDVEAGELRRLGSEGVEG